jgi:acyl-CoA thioester hydrolase
MYTDMGFDDEYFNKGYSSFTLEENLKYFKEFLEGDSIYPSFRIVGLNRKCIHILGCLLDSDNNISTVYETVLGHIDMNLRKIIEMDDSFFNSITSLKHSHDNLGNIPFDLRLVVKESV